MSVWSISGTVREHGVSDRAECGVGVSDGDGDGVRVPSPESTQFMSEGSTVDVCRSQLAPPSLSAVEVSSLSEDNRYESSSFSLRETL